MNIIRIALDRVNGIEVSTIVIPDPLDSGYVAETLIGGGRNIGYKSIPQAVDAHRVIVKALNDGVDYDEALDAAGV